MDWLELGVGRNWLEVVDDLETWPELVVDLDTGATGIGDGLDNMELEEVLGLGTAELDIPAIASSRSSFT